MAYSFAQSVKENNRHTDDRIPQDADGYVDLSDNNDIGFAWIDNVERQINWDKTVRDVNDDNFMTARGDMLRTTLHQDTKESPQHNGDLGETYKKDFLRGTGRDVNIMLGVKQKENDHRPTRDYKLGASGRCPDLEFSRRVDFLGKSKKRNELDRSRVAQSFDTGRIDNAIQSSRRDNNLRMTSVQDTHLENTQDYDNLGQTYKNNVFQGTECDRDKITSREDPDSSTDYETTTRWGQSKYYKRSRKNPASPTYDRTAFRKSKHGDAGRKLSTLAEVNKKDGLQAAKTYDYAYSGVISKSQANNNAHTPGWNMMADSPFMGNMNNQFNQVIPRLAPSSTMSDYSSEKWDEQSTTDSSSTGSISLEEQAAKRSRLIIVCLILIAILSLIAIVVPAVILVSRPDDITEKYALETRVISESFTDELQNNQSEEYRNFTSLFCKELERTANESNQQQHFIKSFEGCTVSRLRRGSVVVSFIIVITRSKGSNRLSTDTLKSLLGISSSEDVQLGSFIIGTELVVLDVKILENDEPAIPNINCGNLPSIENGNMTSNGSMYGSILSILCYEGHQFHDGGNRTNIGCVAHGSWGELPPCIPKKCSFIQLNEHVILENGTIEASYSYGTTLGVHCENGYTLQGEVTITCQSDTIWTNDTVCIPINCTGFDIPRNTYIEKGMNSKHIYKDNVTFVCKEGFTMIGDAIITCQANKSWTSLPSCAPVNCTNVVLPSHSGIITDNHSEMLVYNDSLTLFCDNGYDLNGSSEVWCLHDGNWTQFPSCDPVRCEKLLWPVNSVINMNLTNLLVYNESISIECINGYQLNGSDTVTCLSDGNLTDVPNCDPVVCKQFTVPDFSKRMGMAVNDIATEYYVNDTVIFECLTNYVMFGNANVTCLFDGNWSPLPKCVNCQNFTVDDGTVIIEQPEAVVMCSTGFVLDGNDTMGIGQRYKANGNEYLTVACSSSGKWNDSVVCNPVVCTNNHVLNSGYILSDLLNEYDFNTSVTVACADNYTMFGEGIVTCLADGNWSSIPKCVQCSEFEIENGTVNISQPVAKVMCDTGFILDDNDTVICKEDGNWTALPVCKRIPCPNFNLTQMAYADRNITNNVFGDILTISCGIGYKANGQEYVKVACNSSGKWNDSVDCDPVICRGNDTPANAYILNGSSNELSFNTSENYTMFGEDTVTCLADGNLSSIPKCVQCPEFEIENGTVNISQPVAEVMCDTGFVLEGNDTIKCQDNGNWTTLPHCEIVDCGPPDNVDNGIIELNAANETVFKSKAYIKCDYGFEISGDGILNCEANASWIGYKRCNIITCPTYNVTANMAIMNDTGLDMYDLNTTLRLNCTDGYSFTTNETFVVCVASGGWEGNPACHIDQCTVFDIDNGNYSSMLSVVDFNETIIFSCNDGYDIFGENILVCGAKGRWSDYPKCVPINCTAFERPNNSTVTPEKDIYIFNDSVVVNCSEGFELVGNASTQCLPNGSWTSYPTCERVGCGKYSVANGKVNSTEDINGTTMHVVCDVGYSLVGNSTVVCKEDGSWTSGVSCLIIDCGNYTANASARYNVDPGETQFDSRLQVTCIPGTVFTESSDKEVICKENGWHGNPECEIPVNFVSNTYELSVSEPGIITCIGSLSNWTQIHIESEDDSTSVILFANGTNNLGNTTNIDVSRSVINETAAMLVVDFTPVACPATGEESLNYTCAIQTDSVNYSAITSIRFHKARGNLTFVLPKSAQEGELTGQRDPLQCSLELGYPAEQFVLKIETYNSSTRNYETFNRGKNQSTVAGEDCPPNIKLEYINMNFSSTENGTRLRCNPCNGTGTYTIKHPTACEYFIKCQNGIMSALRCEAEGTCPIILDLDFTACTSEQCNEC
ncbi:SVEP1-like protein [Mya arenaria]|uniref:SVEP1-like protein n=1 Tax=Mya arenaria TaxID=6604 RepID=A0ABY7G378_MYAAR|nr:SVEP1-like protein [Mya arenaria]